MKTTILIAVLFTLLILMMLLLPACAQQVMFEQHGQGNDLIVYSPGTFMPRALYNPLVRALTDAGFRVTVPAQRDFFDMSFQERIDHVNTAIEANPKARIGVSGHSRGAMTAALLAGVKTPRGDYHNHRVKACLTMSTPGPDSSWFNETSWSQVRIPFFVMTGENDAVSGRKQELVFQLLPPGNAYLFVIPEAGHMFQSHPKAIQYTVQFFRATIKNDKDAKQWIKKNAQHR